MKDWKFHCVVLGVRENAGAKEVRRAYRRLALERHPDKHNGSTKSKEDFQQLVESYNFLIEGIVEGRGPQPSPPPQATAAEPRTASPFNAPVNRRTTSPARVTGKSKSWLVWAQAAAVGAVLLAGSVGFELWSRNSRPGRHDRRDLSQQAICQVQAPGTKDFLAYSTESACRGRCLAQAHANCSWDGSMIGDTPATAPVPEEPAANPVDEVEERAKDPKPGQACRVSVKKSEDLVTDYKEMITPIGACRTFCNQVLEQSSSFGVHCEWGKEILTDRALRKVPPEDAKPWAPMLPNPADNPVLADGDAASTCFMTVLVPENPQTLSIPNETIESCGDKCYSQIQLNQNAQVHCYYAGREIIRHMPDPERVYLEEHPEAKQLLMNGANLEMCKITGTAKGGTVDIVNAMVEPAECQAICGNQMRAAPGSTHIGCTYKGKPFSP